MAVDCEAVQQIQHQHDEHQVIQSQDDTESQNPPGGKEKPCEGADDRRQMRRIGSDNSGNADIKEQEKVKILRLRGN